MLSSVAGLMEIRAQSERDSGTSLKLFGFIAESVFTFIPGSCSRSSRNRVRNHPGIAFTFPRIRQSGTHRLKACCNQVRDAENPLRESAANLSKQALFQALPDGRYLRLRNLKSFQGFS